HRQADGRGTGHQGGATAPLKWQRGFPEAGGRLQLPLLHTAGGLGGGEDLAVRIAVEAGAAGLITSVAAQKVYGTVGRSLRVPEGQWSQQRLGFELAPQADLEWLPQELVLYRGGLFEQRTVVQLAAGASWLGAEVVRLGRTADGECLDQGAWRSSLQIRRGTDWEFVDRLAFGPESLDSAHGLAQQPVFGSLVWAAPDAVPESLIVRARAAAVGLEGAMACGRLERGLVARYCGPSTQAARFWVCRLWALIRAHRGLPPPELPRVWPFQEDPLEGFRPAG
ncbi:MAG: urease accessory protein UreD, partial [Cyanobacteriota bacterium]